MDPAPTEESELQRRWVGRREDQDAAGLELRRRDVEHSPWIHEMLDHVPHGYDIRRRRVFQSGRLVRAVDDVDFQFFRKKLTAPPIHLNRHDVKTGRFREVAEAARRRSYLDQKTIVLESPDQLDLILL